jgi:hypothetical protein
MSKAGLRITSRIAAGPLLIGLAACTVYEQRPPAYPQQGYGAQPPQQGYGDGQPGYAQPVYAPPPGYVPSPSAPPAGTCRYWTQGDVDGLTTGELTFAPGANGKLAGTFRNATPIGSGSGTVPGGAVREGAWQGDELTLNLNPTGWQSDIVIKGLRTPDGRLAGPVTHYSKAASITLDCGAGGGYQAGGAPGGGASYAQPAGVCSYWTQGDVDGLTSGQLSIAAGAGGKLAGTFNNATAIGSGSGTVPGGAVRDGTWQGDELTLNLNPTGWQSDIVIKARRTPNGQFAGPVTHYSKTASITLECGGAGVYAGGGAGAATYDRQISGTWRYGAQGDLDGLTGGELTIAHASDGRLTGAFHNATPIGSGSGTVPGGAVRDGRLQGDEVTLYLNPTGWASDIVVKGRLVADGAGVRIVGSATHYSKTASITLVR